MPLEKATLINTRTQERIEVMFNPEEYTLEQGNSFAEVGIPGLQAPPIQYVRGNLRSLRMDLFFDTYTPPSGKEDVRIHTRRIAGLMEKDPVLRAPPVLIFAWGRLQFQCVLDTLSQRFTMFLSDGTPVRATMSVTFKEYRSVEIEVQRGFFAGPPTLHNVMPTDTLSAIAADALGDPGAWREIAELNDIDDPRRLPPGIPLLLPARERRTTRPGALP
jgi:hypothetical protein